MVLLFGPGAISEFRREKLQKSMNVSLIRACYVHALPTCDESPLLRLLLDYPALSPSNIDSFNPYEILNSTPNNLLVRFVFPRPGT